MNVGDKVKILKGACLYPSYKEMAEKMKLTAWGKWRFLFLAGKTGKIVAIEKHESTEDIIAGVELESGEQIIISTKWLAEICPGTGAKKPCGIIENRVEKAEEADNLISEIVNLGYEIAEKTAELKRIISGGN